ncbi:BadF/BadG/BcrA/BcrD ATPase family protein [Agaribacter flavus]|uniref:BadF/BadG/BcrA/BcrD ATPase family protein n=1 Tax=Agaribacter flavus TaxID=1902781 RepID=A0ABV7FTW9_9ALTE
MNETQNNQKCFYLGIDGGGTKTKARLEDADGTLLGEGLAGPSNLVRGTAQAVDAFLTASNMAFKEAGLDSSQQLNTSVCIGVAGATVEPYLSELKQWSSPFQALKITTDLHIALAGAHKGKDGATIIMGTGFCAGIQYTGQYQEIGGHGLLLGDGGSGAMLGLKSIRLCLEALDGVIAHTTFTRHLLTKLNVEDAHALVTATINQPPAFFATLAPDVFAFASQQDPLALSVVNDIARFTERYIVRLQAIKPVPLSLIGGISRHIFPYLASEFQVICKPPQLTPDQGAVILAREM